MCGTEPNYEVLYKAAVSQIAHLNSTVTVMRDKSEQQRKTILELEAERDDMVEEIKDLYRNGIPRIEVF